MRTIKKLIIGLAVLAISVTGMQAQMPKVVYDLGGFRHEIDVNPNETVLDYTHSTEITSISIPKGLKKLERIFVDSHALESLFLPDGMNELRQLSVCRGINGYRSKMESFVIPHGLVKMRDLDLGAGISTIILPDDFATEVSPTRIWTGYPAISVGSGRKIEKLSVSINMPEFVFVAYGYDRELRFPSAKEMTRNRHPSKEGIYQIDSVLPTIAGDIVRLQADGKYRIETKQPLVFEIRIPNRERIMRMVKKAGGLEITWTSGILQHSLLVTGPWEDVIASGNKHFVRSPHPYGFFRIKPASEIPTLP